MSLAVDDDGESDGWYAIKKFKSDKEEGGGGVGAGAQAAQTTTSLQNASIMHQSSQHPYHGLSQSAVREMALCRELRHRHVIRLAEVMLEDKAVLLSFEYAEYDFLQIIHHHASVLRRPIPTSTLKSFLYQLVDGTSYLHRNWVLHRDLKPANIMVTRAGQVKIGDLGLARLYSRPLQSLYQGDKVVVTIWYRAPELLLGARHYTTAIDLWSIGCIFGELLSLRPLFKGEEARPEEKAPVHAQGQTQAKKREIPFQRDQWSKITEILGTPSRDEWPLLQYMPEYPAIKDLEPRKSIVKNWYSSRNTTPDRGCDLLENLLRYDLEQRPSAEAALNHPWFREEPLAKENCFEDAPSIEYPNRKVTNEAGPQPIPNAPAPGPNPVAPPAHEISTGGHVAGHPYSSLAQHDLGAAGPSSVPSLGGPSMMTGSGLTAKRAVAGESLLRKKPRH